jgi:hypothetical protein
VVSFANVDFPHVAVTAVKWMRAFSQNIKEDESQREDVDSSSCPSIGHHI